MFHGISRRRNGWWRFSQEGTILADIRAPLLHPLHRVTGYAFADNGETYINTVSSDPSHPLVSISVIDRKERSWKPVMEGHRPVWGPLYGISGQNLVLESTGKQQLLFYRVH